MNIVDTSRAGRAADLAARYSIRLSAQAERVLDGAMTPPDLYRALRAAGLDVDARRVLAYSMPKRRALWWGCLCAWDGLREQASAAELALLEVVTAYVHRPGDELRRAAWQQRRPVKKTSPAATLAAAAFFSAGSISTPGGQPVPAPDHLTGRLVSVAVYLSAAIRQPRYYRAHLRHYLSLGEEIAQGKNLWTDTGELAPAGLEEWQATAPTRHFEHAMTSPHKATPRKRRPAATELAAAGAAHTCCSRPHEPQSV